MRIGYLISMAWRAPGRESDIPAHIQLPMLALDLLAKQGHETHLVTNPCPPNHRPPTCMPRGAAVHTVCDGRKRDATGFPVENGIRPGRLLLQWWQVQRCVRRLRLDVLHVHGYDQAITFAALLRRTGLPCPVVATLYKPPQPGRRARQLWRTLDGFITATRFVAAHAEQMNLPVSVVKHGLVRHLRAELKTENKPNRRRVLCWRSATPANGMDICRDVYDALAPQYPNVLFTMALRPGFKVEGLEALEQRHENVEIYTIPYPSGVTLPQLMAESQAVLLPFREHSTHPQLAIVESMAAGVPVVTTKVGSAAELIDHDVSGLLVPTEDAQAAIQAVRRLLNDSAKAAIMGEAAAQRIQAQWHWDRHTDDLLAVYRSTGAAE